MLERRAGSRGSRGRAGEAVLSTWTRTLMAAVVIIVIFGIVAGLAVSGRLGDLRYANIPVVHPWPPAGYYQNPFNPADKGDLVNAQEAAAVKADLLADGQVELQAVATGDGSRLSGADTGNALVAVENVLATNAAAGVVERQQTHLTSVIVGRLADPNNQAVTWCVQEKGTGTLSRVSTADGKVLSTQSLAVVAKFWLVRVGRRWLITDSQISPLPSSGS